MDNKNNDHNIYTEGQTLSRQGTCVLASSLFFCSGNRSDTEGIKQVRNFLEVFRVYRDFHTTNNISRRSDRSRLVIICIIVNSYPSTQSGASSQRVEVHLNEKLHIVKERLQVITTGLASETSGRALRRTAVRASLGMSLMY